MSLISELKRRSVFHVGIAYAVASWVLVQVGDVAAENFEAPAWVMKMFITSLIVGFPIVVFFSWAYELTPEGIKREEDVDRNLASSNQTSRKLDFFTIALLFIAIAFIVYDRTAGNPLSLKPNMTNMVQQETDPTVNLSLAGSVVQKSIAVLPFVDMSADKDQEYLSDGISEELLNSLAKVQALRVTSRSSAFSYKGKDFKISDVGRELGVDHVLEGSVRKSGNMVRITAQLVEVGSDTHLWSETFDRKLDNIFQIQDEIASKVVTQLKLKLLGDKPSTNEVDPEAFALFLQARKLGREYTSESLEKSNSLYRQALAIEPGYAQARVALGGNSRRQESLGPSSIQASFMPGRVSSGFTSSSAASFFPENADPTLELSDYFRDLQAAARQLEFELAQESVSSDTLLNAASLALDLGKIDNAIRLIEQVIAKNPKNASAHSSLGSAFMHAGRFEEALANYQSAAQLGPGRIGVHHDIGNALLLMGEAELALKAYGEESDEDYRLKGIAMSLYSLNRVADYEEAIKSLVDGVGEQWPMDLAELFAWVGKDDLAFNWLGKELLEHGGLTRTHSNPFLFSLQNDQRWIPLHEKAGATEKLLNTIEFIAAVPDQAYFENAQ